MLRASLLVCVIVIVQPLIASADVYHGLEIQALGNASLVEQGDHLHICNIGCSGDDGVQADVHRSGGFLVNWFDIRSAPGWAPAETTVVDVNALADTYPINLEMKLDDLGSLFEPDFSGVGAISYRAEVWMGGEPVAYFTANQLPIRSDLDAAMVEFATDGVVHPLPEPMPGAAKRDLITFMIVRLTNVSQVTVGAQSVFGDEIRFFPENPAALPDAFSQVDITVCVPPSIEPAEMVIAALGLKQFSRYFTAGGNVVMHAGDGMPPSPPGVAEDIVLSFAEGDTGSVSLREAIEWANNDPTTPTTVAGCDIWDFTGHDVRPGESDRFAILGRFASAPEAEVELATLTSVHDGVTWTVTADFTPVSGSNNVLLLFDQTGALVLEVPGFAGTYMVDGNAYPVELGSRVGADVSLVEDFGSNQTITVPGFSPVSASKSIVTATATTIVQNTTGHMRRLSNMPAGDYHLKVSQTEHEWISVSSIHAGPTGNAYVTFGHDYAVYDPNPDAAGGRIAFSDPDLSNERFGVEWLDLGPPTMPGGLDLDITIQNENPSADTHAGLYLVANGAGADLYVDPGTSGVTEAEVIVRDASGAILLQFTHANFGSPALTSTEWPLSASYVHSRASGQVGLITGYLSADIFVPLLQSSGAAGSALPPGKKDVEVDFKPPEKPEGPKKLEVGSNGLGPMIFGGDQPVLVTVGSTPPARMRLQPAYPNPFYTRTTLSFKLETPGDVSLRIYDVAGRLVTTLHQGPLGAGPHLFEWDGINRDGHPVASGIYLVELLSPQGIDRGKLDLVK